MSDSKWVWRDDMERHTSHLSDLILGPVGLGVKVEYVFSEDKWHTTFMLRVKLTKKDTHHVSEMNFDTQILPQPTLWKSRRLVEEVLDEMGAKPEHAKMLSKGSKDE